MPHFDEYGGDEWICQTCARVFNSRVESIWVKEATASLRRGNACPSCVAASDYPIGAGKVTVKKGNDD